MKREEVKGRCKKDRATQIKMKFQIKDRTEAQQKEGSLQTEAR